MEQVFVTPCESYDPAEVTAAVAKLFDFLQPADVQGKKVLVKPNLLLGATPESAVITHPVVALAVADYFDGLGACVIMAESGGYPYESAVLKSVYKKCGYSPLCDKYLYFHGKTGTKDCKDGMKSKQFQLIAPAIECDIIVGIAKLKTHGLTRFSGACKNMFGTIPGLLKPTYHAKLPKVEDFSEMLVDLCETVAPTFSIIDGIIGMEGNGPSGGMPKYEGILMASRNPYALDATACRIIGIAPMVVYTTSIAKRRQLFQEPIDVIGMPKETVRFMPAETHPGLISLLFGRFNPFKKKRKLPHISERCTRCGACVKVCPKDTIVKDGTKLRIDTSNCILCYCCHEFCPHKAIDFVKNTI